MATEFTNIVTFTNPDGFVTSKTNWYKSVSDGGTSMIPVILGAPVAQTTQTRLSTIFLTLTTILPSSFNLPWKSPTTSVSRIDTTAVALSSIASYISVQVTAIDPWTKDHLSSAISQYTSWPKLSSGYTTTSIGSEITAMSPLN